MKFSYFSKTFVLLALVIAVAVPVCAMSGSGTSSDPYTVANLADLKMVANNPASYYKQTADIVINDPSLFEFENGAIAATVDGAEEWEPIENFTGSYDGGTFYITGLYVTDENANGGLFANVNGGTVANLNMEFALVESDEYAGIIAGKVEGAATINNCMVAGSVIGKTTKSMNTVGGLAGLVGADATVTASVSHATVTGATSYSANVGGLVGVNRGTVSTCAFSGKAFGTATYYDAAIGGIAGYNTGTITNSLVAATVGGESTAYVNDCYVGGIAGVDKGTVEECLNDDDSIVTVNNYSNGDSVCAAGGIVGAAFDTDVCYNTNNAAVSGDYSYIGGIAGIVVSDSGVHYVEYNDNNGSVSTVTGVAGGIVGRAVAAGEGYVSIKLYISECYNGGEIKGLSYGEMAGETATVESAQVIVGDEGAANNNSCQAPNIFVIVADKVQYGSTATATTSKIAGNLSGALGSKSIIGTEKSNMKIIRYKRRSANAFFPAPVYVEVVTVTNVNNVEAVNLDVSDLKYADGKITGNVVVKVYRPSGDTTAYNVVVGTSVGNKFVAADFATVTGNERVTLVTVPVNCEAPEGTIAVNALVVGTTNAMDPICENIEVTK